MTTHLFKTALGQALREARERTPGYRGRCLSQSAVARALDIRNGGTVGEYERGDGGFPPDKVIFGYAELCDTTYDALIDRAAQIVRDETMRRGADPSG